MVSNILGKLTAVSAFEVVLGPNFSKITRLTPTQAIEITDKVILKYLIDNRGSMRITLEGEQNRELGVYILTFEKTNEIFYFTRDDMIKYKLRSLMYELDTKSRSADTMANLLDKVKKEGR